MHAELQIIPGIDILNNRTFLVHGAPVPCHGACMLSQTQCEYPVRIVFCVQWTFNLGSIVRTYWCDLGNRKCPLPNVCLRDRPVLCMLCLSHCAFLYFAAMLCLSHCAFLYFAARQPRRSTLAGLDQGQEAHPEPRRA